jgi:hypothetical protein
MYLDLFNKNRLAPVWRNCGDLVENPWRRLTGAGGACPVANSLDERSGWNYYPVKIQDQRGLTVKE